MKTVLYFLCMMAIIFIVFFLDLITPENAFGSYILRMVGFITIINKVHDAIYFK